MASLNVSGHKLGAEACATALRALLQAYTSSPKYAWPIWQQLSVESCFIQSHLAWKYVGELQTSAVSRPMVLFYETSTEYGAYQFENLQVISAILGECNPFVYYVTNSALDFLLCENDHDYLIAMGEAKDWLLEYVRRHLLEHLGREILNYRLPGL